MTESWLSRNSKYSPLICSMWILCPHWVPGLCHCRLQGERNLCSRERVGIGEAYSPLAWGKFAAIFQMRLLQENLLVVGMFDGWVESIYWRVNLVSNYGQNETFQDTVASGVASPPTGVVGITSLKNARSACFNPYICHRMPFRFHELKCQWKQ